MFPASRFRRDYDRLYHMACDHVIVARMVDKRQVFPTLDRPVDSETRFTHTFSVVQISVAISRVLGQNGSFSAAIALCHDVAHCPYGHLGEIVLNGYLRQAGHPEYNHAEAAPYILRHVASLDLPDEVLEGITWHGFSTGVMQADVPSEYRIVALCDKLAYVLGDTWDTIRVLGSDELRERHTLLSKQDALSLRDRLAQTALKLGLTEDDRVSRLVDAVISESKSAGEIRFNSPEATIIAELRDILSNNVYTQTDLPQDVSCLNDVLRRLIDSDVMANPYLLFALLTDGELHHLSRLPGQIRESDIGRLQVGDLRLPERDNFDFLVPLFPHA